MMLCKTMPRKDVRLYYKTYTHSFACSFWFGVRNGIGMDDPHGAECLLFPSFIGLCGIARCFFRNAHYDDVSYSEWIVFQDNFLHHARPK